MSRDDELRDTSFDREIRAALRGDRAPRGWVQDALAVPSRVAPAPSAPRVPLVALLAPHLLGLGLLVGLIAAIVLLPGLRSGLADGFRLPDLSWIGEALRPVDGVAAFLTLAVVAVVGIGAGGMSLSRRR